MRGCLRKRVKMQNSFENRINLRWLDRGSKQNSGLKEIAIISIRYFLVKDYSAGSRVTPAL